MPTDTSEKGLETPIVASLIEGAGYVAGDAKDYDRDHAVDSAKLFAFDMSYGLAISFIKSGMLAEKSASSIWTFTDP